LAETFRFCVSKVASASDVDDDDDDNDDTLCVFNGVFSTA
jgi:hypothetical protein